MDTVSRRGFMTSAAVAAAGLAGAGAWGSNERVRVGIIGLRNRGHQVAGDMLGAGRFEIAALCDCDTAMHARAMKELGTKLKGAPRFEQDFRRLLDDPGIDAVVNATPDHWHACITQLALDAGKHVYVEKPMSYNLQDGQRIVAAQRKHPKLVVAVGTQQRSGRHFIEARDFIRGGGLGKVAFARAWITHQRGLIERVPDGAAPETLDYEMWVGPAPFRPYNQNRCHYEWHWAREYGTGEMGNWGAHWLDIVRWTLGLGAPLSASGAGGRFVQDDIKEWPDTQTVIYEYPDTTVLWEQRIWTEVKLNGKSSGAEFQGEKGALVIGRDGWTFQPRSGAAEQRKGSDLMRPHVLNFADAIAGTALPAADAQEGHLTAVLCHLGNISTILNRRVVYDAEAETIVNDAEAAALAGRANRAPWDAVE